MSFEHVPLFRSSIPFSTISKEALLLCNYELDQVHSTVQQVENGNHLENNDLKNISDKLQLICKVYKENVNAILSKIDNFKTWEYPTFEEYNKNSKNPKLNKEQFEHEKALAEFHDMKQTEEIGQLRQVSFLYAHLKTKIKNVLDRTLKLNNPNLKISDEFESLNDPLPLPRLFDIPKLEYKKVYFPEDYKRDQRPISVSHNIVEVNKEKSAPNYSISTPLADRSLLETSPSSPQASAINVSVFCDVGYGNTLGICFEPEWDKQPLLFTHNGEGWTCRVPVGKDCKFVIVQNGKIDQWEEIRWNRRFNADIPSLVLNADQIVFAKN
jgi:hypothetical protein